MRAGVVTAVLGAVLALPAAAAAQDPQVFRFDGGGYDRAAAITTDAAGNSYVGGSAEAKRGASSFVVVKTGPDGARRWTARYDGSRGGAGGEARAVAVDAAGNVYAAGSISDGAVFGQNLDYLVVKFGPDGTQRWAYRYNGPGNGTDLPSAVVVDERRQRVRHRLLVRPGLRLGDAEVRPRRRAALGAPAHGSGLLQRRPGGHGAAAGRQPRRRRRHAEQRRRAHQRRRDGGLRPAGSDRLADALERHRQPATS